MAKAGYVYILTNPSFRKDWVKIGKTRRPVNVRSAELDNTAVPLPFEVYATIKTEQYEKLKKVNAELHRLGEHYMKYRNVATRRIGEGNFTVGDMELP